MSGSAPAEGGPLEPLAIVVAVARDGVLGKDGGLPWHVPEDLRHFRRVTTGHAIVLGRRTWASIGRPLPERRMIVVSRTLRAEELPAGVELARDLDAALARARETDGEPRVVGGAEIYAAALPRTTRLFLTEIDRDVAGDVRFPALYRALGAGDLGSFFPPSDPKWKGAASTVFLAHAAGLVAARGGRIVNLDITIVAEAPRIGPHVAAMKAAIAETCGIAPGRVAVKATTSENMGFVGRREGITALATATVEVPREES